MRKELLDVAKKQVRGLLEMLLVIFVVLKVAGLVDWSWAFVLAPFWVPCAIVGACILLIVLIKRLAEGDKQ